MVEWELERAQVLIDVETLPRDSHHLLKYVNLKGLEHVLGSQEHYPDAMIWLFSTFCTTMAYKLINEASLDREREISKRDAMMLHQPRPPDQVQLCCLSTWFIEAEQGNNGVVKEKFNSMPAHKFIHCIPFPCTFSWSHTEIQSTVNENFQFHVPTNLLVMTPLYDAEQLFGWAQHQLQHQDGLTDISSLYLSCNTWPIKWVKASDGYCAVVFELLKAEG